MHWSHADELTYMLFLRLFWKNDVSVLQPFYLFEEFQLRWLEISITGTETAVSFLLMFNFLK